jgi:hypothetical protein
MPNPFARGPMSGSAMEIFGSLHAPAAPADPLVALFARFTEAVRRYQEQYERADAILEALPEIARGGWPRIDRSLSIFRDFPPFDESSEFDDRDRVSLRELRAHNTEFQIRAGGDPAALAKVRADGRARVRWWIAYRREGDRINAELGADEANELLEQCSDAMNQAADAIVDAEPITLEGALIKLRIVVRDLKQERTVMKGEEPTGLTWGEKGTISVLADFERLVGRARA